MRAVERRFLLGGDRIGVFAEVNARDDFRAFVSLLEFSFLGNATDWMFRDGELAYVFCPIAIALLVLLPLVIELSSPRADETLPSIEAPPACAIIE